jgi:hypothetical protein
MEVVSSEKEGASAQQNAPVPGTGPTRLYLQINDSIVEGNLLD